MKKIFAILAFAAAVVGCKDLYGPTPVPSPAVKSDGINITISNVRDSSFVAEIAPKGDAAYYSYIVLQQPEPAAIDSATLYSCKVKGAVTCDVIVNGSSVGTTSAMGIFKYSDTPSVQIKFDKLKMNTDYQIYAVAGSTTGIPSEVACQSIRTSNNNDPEIVGFKIQGNAATFTFDEPVTYTGGSIEVRYFAMNDATTILDGKPVGAITLGEDAVTTSGNSATILVDEEKLPAGAMYTVNFDGLAFKNSVNTPAEGVDSYVIYSAGAYLVVDAEGNPVPYKYGQVATTTFDLVAPDFAEVYEAQMIYDFDVDGASIIGPVVFADDEVEIAYSYGNGSRKVNMSIPYGEWEEYLDRTTSFVNGIEVFLPEFPAQYEDVLCLEIPQGALLDIYGNESAAVGFEWKYAKLEYCGTGTLVESGLFGISHSCDLMYNPATDTYRIVDFVMGDTNLEFTWDKSTNKLQLVGPQNTGYTNGGDDDFIYAADAVGYWNDWKGNSYDWEFLEINGYHQPSYEDGVFSFYMAYIVPASNMATGFGYYINFDMGTDITKIDPAGTWTSEGANDYWGDPSGAFSVNIAKDEEGNYSISGFTPYILGMVPGLSGYFVPAEWDETTNILTVAYGTGVGVSAGGSALYYVGYDDVDPDVAEYYDDIYFQFNPMSRKATIINAWGARNSGGFYDLYYGGDVVFSYEAPVANALKAAPASAAVNATVKSASDGLNYRNGSFTAKDATKKFHLAFRPAKETRVK